MSKTVVNFQHNNRECICCGECDNYPCGPDCKDINNAKYCKKFVRGDQCNASDRFCTTHTEKDVIKAKDYVNLDY